MLTFKPTESLWNIIIAKFSNKYQVSLGCSPLWTISRVYKPYIFHNPHESLRKNSQLYVWTIEQFVSKKHNRYNSSSTVCLAAEMCELPLLVFWSAPLRNSQTWSERFSDIQNPIHNRWLVTIINRVFETTVRVRYLGFHHFTHRLLLAFYRPEDAESTRNRFPLCEQLLLRRPCGDLLLNCHWFRFSDQKKKHNMHTLVAVIVLTAHQLCMLLKFSSSLNTKLMRQTWRRNGNLTQDIHMLIFSIA